MGLEEDRIYGHVKVHQVLIRSRNLVCRKQSPGWNLDDGRLEAEEIVMMGKPLHYVLGWLW